MFFCQVFESRDIAKEEHLANAHEFDIISE
jgi:hypothetical protein